jgi:hypothetical protein
MPTSFARVLTSSRMLKKPCLPADERGFKDAKARGAPLQDASAPETGVVSGSGYSCVFNT